MSPATLRRRAQSRVPPPAPTGRCPRVIVFGAGPVGLAVAGGLRERGFDVEVFEKRDSIPTVGGVLQLHVEGISALKMLRDARLRPLFKKNCETVIRSIDITDLRKSSEDALCGKPVHHIDLVGRYGTTGVLCTMRRSSVLSILQDTLKGPVPVMSKVCRKIVPGKTLTIEFEDGSSAQCEVLIAADGSHSIVRSLLFPDHAYRTAHAWCIGGVARLPAHCPPVVDPIAQGEIEEVVGADPEAPVSPVKSRSPAAQDSVSPKRPAKFRLGSDSDSPESASARTRRVSSRSSLGGPEFQFTPSVLQIMALLEKDTFTTAFSPSYRLYVCRCDSKSVGWYISFAFGNAHLADMQTVPWSPEQIRTLLGRIASELKSTGHDLFTSLLEHTPVAGEDAPFVWEQGDVDPLPAYARNNVALVGDSAHCMLSPNPVGQGINQGLGDAAVLVDLMEEEKERVAASDFAEFNVNAVLAAYSQRRQPLTAEFQQAQRESFIPFGRWPFFVRVLNSRTFIEQVLAPLDSYTRGVVARDTVSSEPPPVRDALPGLGIAVVIALATIIGVRLYLKSR